MFIERKGFEAVVKELDAEGKDVLLLEKGGRDIRDLKLEFREDKNSVFLIGDHEGFPKGLRKFLKRVDGVSVGPRVLFASQVVVILHNEMDRKDV